LESESIHSNNASKDNNTGTDTSGKKKLRMFSGLQLSSAANHPSYSLYSSDVHFSEQSSDLNRSEYNSKDKDTERL
jgi:hypothetical protein